MKKTNKCVALVLAVITIFSAFSIVPITASAKETSVVSTSAKTPTSGECGKNAKWKIDSKGVLTIYGKGEVSFDSDLRNCVHKNAKEVKVSNGITKLYGGIFDQGVKIKKATIADSVKTLGTSTFNLCESLKTVKIGNGVTKLPSCTFSWCENLKSVELGSKVKSVETDIFENCDVIDKITINKSNKNLCTVNNVIYTKNKSKIVLYPQGKKDTKYSIPKGTKTIGKCAFAFAKNLKNITIPSSVTKIQNSAFISCTKLKKLTIPKTVKVIEPLAYGFQFNMDVNEMVDYEIVKSDGFTIYGNVGSSAYRYSKNFKVNFVKVK